MKYFLKILKWTSIVLAILIIFLFAFVQLTWNKKHDAPYPEISASKDSAIIARGQYLANGPAHCGGCHSSMDEVRAFDEGDKVAFKGGWELSFPGFGTFTGPNLTSDKETGIGNFSDGEITRTLRHGVGNDGRAIFPMMTFQGMSDEDLTAIISYLRTLPPVSHKVKPFDYGIMYRALLSFGLVKPEGPKHTPPKSVAIEPSTSYGKYLAYNVTNCYSCHTEVDMNTGAYIGEPFAGRAYFSPDAFSEGYAYMSPNLTPHSSTGVMANWSEDDFMKRFKSGRVQKGSPMPWGSYSRMNDVELQAIFRFLQSLKPVENKIEKTVFAPGEEP
ncbi:MAG TPA: cytochrome c [Niabella sp.]|nr:cytochrome c [Niabella sp.]HOZ97414.1 cytochrome c [Niabella sp.]HQW15218.1 cytochrome c [Niabella sp.]HQX20314.1 cytochrome c [Niabella sp.]HQX42854.1 cytochrome c [Niabella sp.]